MKRRDFFGPILIACLLNAAALLLLVGCQTQPAREGAPALASVDTLTRLVDERLAVAPRVARAKWNSGAAIDDPAREARILEQVTAQAAAAGVDPALARNFFQAQFEAGKLIQRRLHAQWRQSDQARFADAPDLAAEVRPVLDRLTPRLISALAQAQALPATEETRAHIRAQAEAGDEARALALSPLLAALGPGRDRLTQFSTLGALMVGNYDGATTVAEMLRHGQLGIGTVNGLDGELLVLDGVAYQLTADGRVNRLSDQVQVPFAVVSGFLPEQVQPLAAGTDFAALERLLGQALPTPNLFYALRIDGRFRQLRARSVPRQQPPYRPLTQVVAEQAEFRLENVEGTMVGFLSPPYAGGVNVPGLHLHFISRDRSVGGHVLGFEAEAAVLATDRLTELRLILPEDEGFYRSDLRPPSAADVHKVERPQDGGR